MIKPTVVAVLAVVLTLITVVGRAQADNSKTTVWNIQHFGMDYYYGYKVGMMTRLNGGQYMNGQLSIGYAEGYNDGWNFKDTEVDFNSTGLK